jgi:hypothetical protein
VLKVTLKNMHSMLEGLRHFITEWPYAESEAEAQARQVAAVARRRQLLLQHLTDTVQHLVMEHAEQTLQDGGADDTRPKGALLTDNLVCVEALLSSLEQCLVHKINSKDVSVSIMQHATLLFIFACWERAVYCTRVKPRQY